MDPLFVSGRGGQKWPKTLITPTISHSRLRRENVAKSKRLSVTLSVGTPLCPYGIGYCRAYGWFTRGWLKKPYVVRWKRSPSVSYLLRNARKTLEIELESFDAPRSPRDAGWVISRPVSSRSSHPPPPPAPRTAPLTVRERARARERERQRERDREGGRERESRVWIPTTEI